MDFSIVSYSEWQQRPTHHGCYDDYVQHIRASQRYHEALRDEANNQRVAELIAKKLKLS